MEPLDSGKLTKSFFMNLEEGVFLMSNVAHDIYTPKFAEYVEPVEKREEQWIRIKNADSDQRGGFIFSSNESMPLLPG